MIRRAVADAMNIERIRYSCVGTNFNPLPDIAFNESVGPKTHSA
jgi:hypothetical protein